MERALSEHDTKNQLETNGNYIPDDPTRHIGTSNAMISARHQTFQIRGYCRRNGYLRIAEVLQQCAVLYNAALQERRDAYRMQHVSISRMEQMKQFTLVRGDMTEWANLDVTIGRGVLCRVGRAFQAFFKRASKGQKPGFPRFRSRSRYSCIELSEVRPGMIKARNDGKCAYVRVKGLPTITIRTNRPLPPSNQLKALRINLRPTGVDVDLVYALPNPNPKPTAIHDAAGIDMGVNERLALSDGSTIQPRKVDRAKEEELRRAISRSKKGSNHRRKRVAQLSRHTRRQRVRNRNQCHRITSAIVRKYGRIAVEKLAIPNLTGSAAGTIENPGSNVAAKAGLNRSILEQTWGIIRNQLRYKAECAGGEFVEVDPRFTSQTCSSCGRRRTMPLHEYRAFECQFCDLVMDRDTNAAINILKRAFGPDTQGVNSPAAPTGAIITTG